MLAAACLGFAVPVWAAKPDEKPKVKVEFRRAETKNADGLTPATIAGTDEKIYLHKTADATNADIADARVGVDGACNPAIDVTFTKEGAKKMEALSEKHQDKPLAILIDGKVVSAPVVRAKFSDKAQITGKFTKEEVEKLVKAINAK
jgi:preprotein translocase subunit SecD